MNTNLLTDLHDIHLSSPISWWPPAMGWVILFISLIYISLMAWYIAAGHFKRWQIKREALLQLDKLHKAWQKNPNAFAVFSSLSMLLRRVSLSVFPKEKVAGLSGVAWVQFLNQAVKQKIFNKKLAKILLIAPYRYQTSISDDEIFIAAKKWIKKLFSIRGSSRVIK